MRVNLPVTQRQFDYPGEHMLVSTTDTKGIITHCNHAFVAVSGYTYEELIGQSHNLVRHPDMPSMAYKDMWHTIQQGHPWTGLVKNRRKNGDHYWVQANVTPIMQDGKPTGYMSVRTKPTASQIQATEQLYAQITAAGESAQLPFYLKNGEVRHKGLQGMGARLQRLSLSARMGMALAFLIASSMLPLTLPSLGSAQLGIHLATLLLGSALIVTWFHHSFKAAITSAERFANDLSGCNLTTSTAHQHPSYMGALMRSLRQIQINLHAVVGDVRRETSNFTQSAHEIAAGGVDLSDRTESQASSLQETAASMEQIATTGKHAAEMSAQVAFQSRESSDLATQGGQAVHTVSQLMQAINDSSGKMQEIISVIDGIAFQTNILALNAAVEAARAGEQGRGFAVVASEVRALAGRSAVAAREIKELIEQSSRQVSAGSTQMAGAESSINKVVKSVDMMGSLIELINNSTREQALGISQVNDGMSHIDTLTQQNAAMAEESAASAKELSNSALTLMRSVEVFHLK